MSDKYRVTRGLAGEISPSYCSSISIPLNPNYTHGLVSRAVITKVWKSDEEFACLRAPIIEGSVFNKSQTGSPPKAAGTYVDVVLYGGLPGMPTMPIPRVLIGSGGLHNGKNWVPRATTKDLSKPDQTLDLNTNYNPINLDGDHILVAWLDQDRDIPVCIGQIPHPRQDIGNSASGSVLAPSTTDGATAPSIEKNQGARVTINGDYEVDLLRAYAGDYSGGGFEPQLYSDPTNPGARILDDSGEKGDLRVKLRQGQKLEVQVIGASAGDSSTYKLTFADRKLVIEDSTDGDVLKVESAGADATLALGTANVNAIIAQALKTFWDVTVKPLFDMHTHPIPAIGVTGVCPAGGGALAGGTTVGSATTATTTGLPLLPTTTYSTKVTFPSG